MYVFTYLFPVPAICPMPDFVDGWSMYVFIYLFLVPAMFCAFALHCSMPDSVDGWPMLLFLLSVVVLHGMYIALLYMDCMEQAFADLTVALRGRRQDRLVAGGTRNHRLWLGGG